MPTGTPYPSSSAVSGRGQQCLVTTRSIPATPTMAGVPIPRPPHCRQARIGAGPWFVSSPFYSVPTETPGEGAASGRESRHSGGGGTARYGTVRHGTGSLRVAQSTADTHTVTMFRGSAPGIALTAGKGAQPRSALGLCTPRPPALSSRSPHLGLGARPGGGLRAPAPGRHEGKVADVLGRRHWPRRGSRSRVRLTHCTSIYSARSGGAGGPREAPPGSALVTGGERRRLSAGPGLSSPRATAAGLPPALGTDRQSSRRGDLPQSVGFPRQPGPRSQVHKSAKSFQYSDGLMEKKKRKVQAKNSKH